MLYPHANSIIVPCFHPRRRMMLPKEHELHLEDGRMGFLNLDIGVFVCPRAPLLEDYHVLCLVEGLLLLQRHRQHDNENGGDVCLLHPFTGSIAKFRPITYATMSLGSIHWSSRMERPYLSLGRVTTSLSIGAERVPMLMIMLLDLSRVLFATTKDKQWSFSAWTFSPDNSIISSSKGKIYMLQKPTSSSSDELQIFQIDPPHHEKTPGFISTSFQPPKVIATCAKGKIHTPFELIECDSEMLLVGPSSHHSNRTVVYRVADLILGRVVPLKSLGGNALLIDIASSQSVIKSSLSVAF
uniref:KIB1-4 beta-propeller domain-containing protein n=1 Tax=Aegilops tauschii TaxID=37682 RepID=M8BID6_AEGTA